CHGDIVNAVEFSPDVKSEITVSADKAANVWTFGAESSKIDKTLTGHNHQVFCGTFAPGGKIAATASADKSVKLWTLSDGSNTRTLTNARDWIYVVRFSPDGKCLAAGTWDGDVLLWNVEDGKLEGTVSTMPPRPAIAQQVTR